jgi:hypothetical protein
MKRLGHILEHVAEPENLRLAFWKASRGRRAQPDVARFAENLDRELAQLRRDLLAGTVSVGHYHYFMVRDPKERLVCAAYVRYMDDFVLWSNDRVFLRRAWMEIEAFLHFHLRLRLKSGATLNRTWRGMDFLGARLFPHQTRLSRRSKLRFARKLAQYEGNWLEGRWSEAELQRHIEPLLAFVCGCDSTAFRRAVLRRSRVVAEGLEPRQSGWQLEQRCRQLHVGHPQQQRPLEPQQQQRVPRGARPSSIPPGGTEPAAIRSAARADSNVRLPVAKAPSPPGASSPAGGGLERSGRTPLRSSDGGLPSPEAAGS